MKRLPVFKRPDLCKPCGGACCKSLPGAAFPHDFKLSAGDDLAPVREALKSGLWSLDWWDGDPRDDRDDVGRAIFLRPRTVSGGAVDPSWGGRCSWLGDDGCRFPRNRPSGCRGLEPTTTRCVVRHSSKQEAAIAWLPLSAELERIASERRP